MPKEGGDAEVSVVRDKGLQEFERFYWGLESWRGMNALTTYHIIGSGCSNWIPKQTRSHLLEKQLRNIAELLLLGKMETFIAYFKIKL